MTDWNHRLLGDEIELAYGKALPASARDNGEFPVFGSNGAVGNHSSSLVNGPGIVVGRKGSVGEATYSEGPFWPIDTTYYVVNRSENDWRYLYHLLVSLNLTQLNSHSTIPGLNREEAYSLPILLPEKPEQKRIAMILDQLEQAVVAQDKAIQITEALRRSAMRKIFENGLGQEPLKDTEIGPIPKSWEVSSFAEAREWLQYGTSTRCTTEIARYPVLRIPNIGAGYIDRGELKYCNLSSETAKKYVLEAGDVLFIRTNGVLERLGTCAVYAGEPPNALFASYLIRARMKQHVEPKYVACFYGSELGTSLVASRATPASDGKFNLNTATIDSLPLALPPTSQEQREIVEIVDAIDRKTDLHRRKRAVLDGLYWTLLRKLMIGEVRVADLDVLAHTDLPIPEPLP